MWSKLVTLPDKRLLGEPSLFQWCCKQRQQKSGSLNAWRTELWTRDAYLDEWSGDEETVSSTNLNTAQQRRDTCAVCWQVRQEGGDSG
jgi:hypothetical protein